MADREILTGREKHVSITSSFIANTHNELYAFYTGIGNLLNSEANRRPPHRPLPLNLPLLHTLRDVFCCGD